VAVGAGVSDIDELLVDCSVEYTREQCEADRKRLLAVISTKHGIAESDVDALIRDHRYVHTAEDPEDEYIQVLAFARHANWDRP
jgi:hypothetical protein